MIVAGSIGEACSLLETTAPRLVAIHWTGANARYNQLDRLLWTTTVMARQIPVVVIAERYRIDQAIMLFRMGVSDYISRSHHLGQLGRVFATHLPPAPSSPPQAVPSSARDGAPTRVSLAADASRTAPADGRVNSSAAAAQGIKRVRRQGRRETKAELGPEGLDSYGV